MLKRIDVEPQTDKVDGFSYTSLTGMCESVTMKKYWVNISVSNGTESIDVYNEDIPKLIKALQAAYDDKEQHE